MLISLSLRPGVFNNDLAYPNFYSTDIGNGLSSPYREYYCRFCN